MTRTNDYKKGLMIFKTIYGNGPLGIGFREVKRRTGFANDTLVKWFKRFQSCNLIFRDLRGKIYLDEDFRSRLEKGDILLQSIIPEQNKTRKERISPSKRSTGKRIPKVDYSKRRRDYALCLISTVAALGNSSWNRTTDHGDGFVSMIDVKTSTCINFISRPLKGIGVSDFKKWDKDGTQSMLDTRTFVDFNERFSYLNLSDQEVQFYIDELCNHDPPILKEITVFDYNFLYFVDDSTQPYLVRLERESPFTYTLNATTYSNNIDDKLPLIHEIVYDTHQDRITSRIRIDVNSEKAKKFLGLGTFFCNGNNFSIGIWGERRYIVADSLLKEFIEICSVMFEAINERMEKLYSLSLLSARVRKDYIKWHKGAYGYFRRGAEMLEVDKIAVNRVKQNIKKMRKFEKLDKNEEGKKKIMNELDYACRCRMWGPYEKTGIPFRDVTNKDFENIEKNIRQIDRSSHSMIRQFGKRVEKYYGELLSQKYENIRQTYGIIADPLLSISYSAFIRKLH